MFEYNEEESQDLDDELARLRQIIIQVEPGVMLDGRFEEMITTPASIITIACELINLIPDLKRAYITA